ncbi:MAG: hypothetical protein U5L98_09915 [Halomonas sp.]|uniref:hypothetical protein n=1 Tax=Halomonas sp. TaxID=1486246 RepID=UPI002ACE2FAA|nr:hypothetical protein [Halomonas sp.]MDZ7852940.1 hypothetical protein [Halomonas sp.]
MTNQRQITTAVKGALNTRLTGNQLDTTPEELAEALLEVILPAVSELVKEELAKAQPATNGSNGRKMPVKDVWEGYDLNAAGEPAGGGSELPTGDDYA